MRRATVVCWTSSRRAAVEIRPVRATARNAWKASQSICCALLHSECATFRRAAVATTAVTSLYSKEHACKEELHDGDKCDSRHGARCDPGVLERRGLRSPCV